MFVPYTLVDRAIYEALQVGLLQPILVNPEPAKVPGVQPRSFTLVITPTQVPRARRDPDEPGGLVVEFAVALADTQVATVTLPAISTAPVVTEGASARALLKAKIVSNAAGALQVLVHAARLESLAGGVGVPGQKAQPLSSLRVPIESALNQLIAGRPPRIELAARTVDLVPPFAARIGSPQPGAHYVRVPLSIVAQ